MSPHFIPDISPQMMATGSKSDDLSGTPSSLIYLSSPTTEDYPTLNTMVPYVLPINFNNSILPNAPTTGEYPTLNTMVPYAPPINQNFNNLQQQAYNMSGSLEDQGPPTLRWSPPLVSKSKDDSDLYSRQLRLPSYTQTAQDPKKYPCLILGCSKRFSRTDFHTKHLRDKHRLPIPKGHWANIWISKAENYHYFVAAVDEQARANNILLPRVRKWNELRKRGGPVGVMTLSYTISISYYCHITLLYTRAIDWWWVSWACTFCYILFFSSFLFLWFILCQVFWLKSDNEIALNNVFNRVPRN